MTSTPPTTPSSKKKGRQPGSRKWTAQEDALLCEVVEDKLPRGAMGWVEVAHIYNARRQHDMVTCDVFIA